MLISQTPMSEGLNASSGWLMGSGWRVLMGFRPWVSPQGTGAAGGAVPNSLARPSLKGVLLGSGAFAVPSAEHSHCSQRIAWETH